MGAGDQKQEEQVKSTLEGQSESTQLSKHFEGPSEEQVYDELAVFSDSSDAEQEAEGVFRIKGKEKRFQSQ